MKRPLLLPCALCLLTGLLLGGILPMPWDRNSSRSGANAALYASSQTGTEAEAGTQALDPNDNLSLLNAAYFVLHALKDQDYAALASMVHPVRGVTCTPLSTVSPESDRVLTADQVAELAEDSSVYTWGTTDPQGAPVSMTIQQYFAQYVFDADYTKAPLVGLDQVMIRGNALENLDQVYSDCRFVDVSFPGQDQASQGLDWRSLKLVLQPGEQQWYLVALVHGQWTG